MDLHRNSLVSVLVVSFNSADTILETLESIKKQTYKEIELIVSDDCSIDNTRELTHKWISNNGIYFRRSIVIQTNSNGGPSINCNNGIKECRGAWIKLIAADDVLLPNCIEKNIQFVQKQPGASIVFSRVRVFGDENRCKVFVEKYSQYGFFSLTQRQQYLMILRYNLIHAPTMFVSKDIFMKYGIFEETIPFMEDWPFWVKILSLGVKPYFINEETVKYRLTPYSISACLTKDHYQWQDVIDKYLDNFYKKENLLYRVYVRNISSLKRNVNESIFHRLKRWINPYSIYYRFLSYKIIAETKKLNYLFKEVK